MYPSFQGKFSYTNKNTVKNNKMNDNNFVY